MKVCDRLHWSHFAKPRAVCSAGLIITKQDFSATLEHPELFGFLKFFSWSPFFLAKVRFRSIGFGFLIGLGHFKQRSVVWVLSYKGTFRWWTETSVLKCLASAWRSRLWTLTAHQKTNSWLYFWVDRSMNCNPRTLQHALHLWLCSESQFVDRSTLGEANLSLT